MASSLGNLNMSDMKWIGEPLDVVGQYQKGVNLAEQGQRMQQSADMHPLKMDDAKARTNLVKQQGEYNTRTMDSRVGLSDSMARLQQTAASIAENTQGEVEDRARALSRQELVNADVMEATVGNRILGDNARHQRSVTDQETNLANQANAIKQFSYETEMMASRNRLAQGTEKQRMSSFINHAQREEEEHGRWETQGAAVDFQLHALDNMTLQELDNYHIPSSITSSVRRADIQKHLAALKGTERYRDYTDVANSVDATTAARRLKYTKAQGELDARTFKILDLPGKFPGLSKPFREENGELNQAGEVMLDKLAASGAVWSKLSGPNKQKLIKSMRSNPTLPGLWVPPNATSTGKYGSDYNGQMVLDDEGVGYATELLEGQRRAGELSQSKWAAQVLGLEPETMDAKGNIIRKRSMPSREVVLDAVTKQITAITARVVSQKELEDETKLTNQDLIDIRTEAFKNVDAGLIPRGTNAADILGVGAGATYGTDGKTLVRPGVGATPTTGTTGAALPAGKAPKPPTANTKVIGQNDPNDLMMGRGGYSTVVKMGTAAHTADTGNWENRGAIFNNIKDRFTSGSDDEKDMDARFITKLVIDDKWKTGHSVGAAFSYVFRKDPGSESSSEKIMGAVRTHSKENVRESVDDLKIAMWGEGLLGGDNVLMMTQDNLNKITAAVKKHGSDYGKWPKLVGRYNNQTHAAKYTATSAKEIVKQVKKFNVWNNFSNRIKSFK
jgi:hypothetical protein